jgi:hypothetical protein
MGNSSTPIEIRSRDYWFKVVDFLQQNWALIDEDPAEGCIVYFCGDASGVFDRLKFASTLVAEEALRRNGFKRFDLDEEAQKFIHKPEPPFFERAHPNGPIYSSGRLWH